MKNKRRIIGIAAATLLALIGTISLVGYVNSAKDDAVAKEALIDVYVVDEFVPVGAEPETIRASVSIERVPARLKQSGAVTDLDEVGEQVAASDLEPGDQLVAARLAPKAQVSQDVTDKVQISALLEAERAVGGALSKGDLVGVYLSFDPFDVTDAGIDPAAQTGIDSSVPADPAALIGPTGQPSADTTAPASAKTPNISRLEFQNVLVTNVQTINPPVNPDDSTSDNTATVAQVTGTQYVVTLAMSPEQSERFVFATEFGSIWLSLDPGSVADDGTRPVTLSNVFRVIQ